MPAKVCRKWVLWGCTISVLSSAQIRTTRNLSSNVPALFDNAFSHRSEWKRIKDASAWRPNCLLTLVNMQAGMHPSFVHHMQIKPHREKLLQFFNPFSLAFQNKSILDIEHLHFLQVCYAAWLVVFIWAHITCLNDLCILILYLKVTVDYLV